MGKWERCREVNQQGKLDGNNSKLKPQEFISKNSSYETGVKEVKRWAKLTLLPKVKHGLMISYSLIDHKSGFTDKIDKQSESSMDAILNLCKKLMQGMNLPRVSITGIILRNVLELNQEWSGNTLLIGINYKRKSSTWNVHFLIKFQLLSSWSLPT